ncbi:MAG: VWA domain-containing protein [Acidobacteriota bacterium]|nr:VWA domain-containing protein [Acidobacteriota bacterium]MDH3528347.1 VWA domain-containing protein [Acidobacteriota bacterium]
MTPRTPHILLISILITAIAAVTFGQNPVATPPPLIIEDDEVINIDSRLVIVPVSVTDGNGRPVKGLGVEHFSIFENKRAQSIVEVSDAEKVPLEIALLFDISGSTDPMFKFEQETAAKFLQDVMRPEDRATIFTIGETPIMLQPRNVAYRSIETIRGLQPTKQYTAFYDTVMAAAIYLRENASPKSRKVVIAITDGEDTNSEGIKRGFSAVYASIGERINSITTKEYRDLLVQKRNEIRIREQNKTLKRLQDADTVFYSVNPAGSSYKLNKISLFGQSNMQRFADETGGTAFLPKFLPIDLKSNYENSSNLSQNTETLSRIFSALKNELQAQYLVQYYSNNEFPPNKYVDVETSVNLNLPQGLNIRSRKGYFVKQQ